VRTWQFPEVHPPIAGPWADEPDKAQWIDSATGLDCLIVRSGSSGALCGYVGVPPEHPWHGLYFDAVDVQVHGGLTFADRCEEWAEDGRGVCHVPEPGRPADVWWFGFDCAHAFDLAPAYEHRSPPVFGRDDVYRDFAYVQAEVTQLAAQIATVAA
jgi:hypothetical protein